MRQDLGPGQPFRLTPATAILVGFFMLACVLFIFQIATHTWAWMPFGFIVFCPLMMLFMMFFMMRGMHN